MANIRMVLDRASTHGRIKQIGQNSWKAFSPLRSESDPSVSITFMPAEDKILINDFGDPDSNATARILMRGIVLLRILNRNLTNRLNGGKRI